jgi:hypothetical protein
MLPNRALAIARPLCALIEVDAMPRKLRVNKAKQQLTDFEWDSPSIRKSISGMVVAATEKKYGREGIFTKVQRTIILRFLKSVSRIFRPAKFGFGAGSHFRPFAAITMLYINVKAAGS